MISIEFLRFLWFFLDFVKSRNRLFKIFMNYFGFSRFSRIIIGFSGISWIFGFSWIFMDFQNCMDYSGFSNLCGLFWIFWIFLDFSGFSWICMDYFRFSWIILDFHGLYWIFQFSMNFWINLDYSNLLEYQPIFSFL